MADPHGSHGPDDLPIDFSEEGGHLVIALRGEIDLANACSLPRKLAPRLAGHSSVRIDLGEVTFLGAAGLRAFLMCRDQLGTDATALRVRNASISARRLFEITDLADLLE